MEEKRPNTPRNSTVAVSPEIGKKLERFCDSCGITKKDFISLSLDYFQRYGINPAKHESPAKEMEKLIKKNDWKSHSTLTLLATQDLPTFLYYMIDPLKSWCWGAILFYPFKNSRFS